MARALDGLAVWTSRLFHPFVVPIPTLVAALRLGGASSADTAWWTSLCVAIGVAPVTVWLVADRVRRGDGDWYVTVREQRHGLYALGGACLVALLGVLVATGAPRILTASLVGAVAATTIGALLNRRTKPSVHAGAAAGCAVLLAHVAPSATVAGAAALALVAWARLRLAHHTPAQIALGAIVSGGCTVLALRILA